MLKKILLMLFDFFIPCGQLGAFSFNLQGKYSHCNTNLLTPHPKDFSKFSSHIIISSIKFYKLTT